MSANPSASDGFVHAASVAEAARPVADVLIIDDTVAIRSLLRAFLDRDPLQKYSFAEAGSVAEAGAQCRMNMPDVVLLDIGLPDGTGFDFLKTQRDDMGLFPFAVIILTGETSEERAIEALRAGVQDYLKKGRINQETLRRAVRMSLEKHTLLRHVREQRTDLARQIDRLAGTAAAAAAAGSAESNGDGSGDGASVASVAARMESYYLNSLLLSMPDRIYFKDKESRFLRVNPAMARLAQMADPEHLIGKTDQDVFTHEHAGTALEDEQRILATGEPLVGLVEKETLHCGRVMWVSTTKMPLRDSTGAVVGTFGISRDITHIKHVEDDLRQANEELARHEKELENALDKLEATHRQLLDAQQHLGEAEKMQTVGRLAAGIAHEVKNPLGVLSMGLGYLRSCLLPAAQEQAGGTAIERPEPPRGIRSAGPARHPSTAWMPSSGKPCPPATALKVIDQMQKAVDRAQNVVHELLDFSKPSSTHPLGRVDLDKVVRDALRLVRHTMASRHIRVQENIGLGLPQVLGDSQKLSQLLLNLLMNAADAMDPKLTEPAAIGDPRPAAQPFAPEPDQSSQSQSSSQIPHAAPGGEGRGQHTLVVTLRETVLHSIGANVGSAETGCFRVGDRLLMVEIDDSGPGIPAEVLGRIFDPFFTTKPTSHGTGLGLSVARTIAELHGGVLRIRNLPGRGARASLTLRALAPGEPLPPSAPGEPLPPSAAGWHPGDHGNSSGSGGATSHDNSSLKAFQDRIK